MVGLGRPSRAAFGCFLATTGFLALVAVAAIAYAVVGPASSSGPVRIVAATLGGIFVLLVAGLLLVTVRAARGRQGLAFDAGGVWWRSERQLVRIGWDDLQAVGTTPPLKIKGIRTSAPRTPSVHLWPADDALLRDHPELTNRVSAGEPPREDLPTVRISFALESTAAEAEVGPAVERFAPALWVGNSGS